MGQIRSKSFEEVQLRLCQIQFAEQFDTIVAIAHGGLIPAAMLQQRLGGEFYVVKLSLRNSLQQPIYKTPLLIEPLSFDPIGRHILLVEDRVKTGATLEYATRLLTSAALLRTFAVNGRADYSLYDEACFRFPWIM